MVDKVDPTDLKIINILQTNGRASITELAKKVGSSRPTVTNRLKRLLDEELVIVRGGLNIKNVGFKIACTGLEAKNEATRRELEQTLTCCPRVLSIFRTAGKANIHIVLWGEEDQTISSTIESFRDIPNVEVVYTHNLGTPIHGDIMIPVVSKEVNETPCGKDCSVCYRYQKDWCVGCPITVSYKNPFKK